MIKNVYSINDTTEIIGRINQLKANSEAKWGKMKVAQMLAHCNVTYEMVYDDKHKKPSGLMKWVLKLMIKNKVVNNVPYKHNSPTAPQFLIKVDKDFNTEKERLIEYILKTQQLGASHFEGLESHSFGKLTSQEWNNMFYKHIDHHLSQFGV